MKNQFESFATEKPKLPAMDRKELNEKIYESDFDERGVDKLLEQLLTEKERFSSIFRTENGSHYFILHDGSSLRFQQRYLGVDDEDDNTYALRPIANHVFFVDPPGALKLRELMNFPGYALQAGNESCAISTTELKKGSLPFEYGFPSVRNIIPVFKLDATTATYVGSEENGRIKPIVGHRDPASYDMGVTHLGHAVSEVLWQAKAADTDTSDPGTSKV